MNRTAVKLLMCLILAVLLAAVPASADSPVGHWSGSFGGEGRSSSASATFRSDGSCTLHAMGFSASGSYGGGRIHVSAYGYSMSLSYSCHGNRMTIRGSKGKYSGSMSLRRTGSSGDSEEALLAETASLYGQWTAEQDGVRYDVEFYQDGFAYWVETPAPDTGAQGKTEARAYGARLTPSKDALTLTPLDTALAADVPALWAEAGQETEKSWTISYKAKGGSLVLSSGNGALLTLNRIGDVDAAPPQTLFRPYIRLEKGDKGEAVKQLQDALAAAGYLDGAADGAFGAKTRAAVKSFQSAQGLHADGVAGHDVLTALYKDGL